MKRGEGDTESSSGVDASSGTAAAFRCSDEGVLPGSLRMRSIGRLCCIRIRGVRRCTG